MNAWYFLPGLGRFLSADTIVPNPANPQSFNRYTYVRNSAINFTDPSGHRECESDEVCSPPASSSTSPRKHADPGLVYDLANLTKFYIGGRFEVDTGVLIRNIGELLAASRKYGLTRDETAYLLATAFGETRFGAQVNPGFFDGLVEKITFEDAESNYGSESSLAEALGNAQEGDGWLYRGRGFVQLTGRGNYQAMQEVFGDEYSVDMIDNPDVMASNPALAAETAVYGMVNGSFSGYSFADAAATDDFFYNARRIINGTSNAYVYKSYAVGYRTLLGGRHLPR